MKQHLATVFKSVFIGISLLLGTNSCDEEYDSVIPYVPVNMNINPTSYIELNIPGGYVEFKNAGCGGIMVFQDMAGSENTFFAFDAACTYEVSSLVRIVPDGIGTGTATCPVCKSQYILFGGSGSPVKGPAIEPLRQYRTSYAAGRINVRN